AAAAGAARSKHQRRLKEWEKGYWKERTTTPLYYAAVSLFTTWPLAIPVASVLSRSAVPGQVAAGTAEPAAPAGAEAAVSAAAEGAPE
ncbi:unnamed protein product, partial [Prorocentrum cordatum]